MGAVSLMRMMVIAVTRRQVTPRDRTQGTLNRPAGTASRRWDRSECKAVTLCSSSPV